jgi:hypothetical protein
MKLSMVSPTQIENKQEGKTSFPYLEEGQKVPCLACGSDTKRTNMAQAWDEENYVCVNPECKRVHECKIIYNAEAMKKSVYTAERLEIVRVW